MVAGVIYAPSTLWTGNCAAVGTLVRWTRTPALMSAVAAAFLQTGGQLFAISVMVRTMVAEPPRSFQVLEGPFGYDSSGWWDTVPNVTFTLLMLALALNWRSPRRGLLVWAFAILAVTGIVAVFWLEPLHAEAIAGGYTDAFDPALWERAQLWYRVDWLVCGLSGLVGLVSLTALLKPVPESNVDR